MSVALRKKTVFGTIMVVVSDSAYNAILERPWIHQMDAMTLYLHKLHKFLKKNVVEMVRED